MKTRIISAAVAIAIAIPFVYFGGIYYAFAIGLLAILGFKEIIDLKKSHGKIPFLVNMIAILGILLMIYTNIDGSNVIYGITYMRTIFLALSLLIPTLFYKNDSYTTKDAFYLIGISLFLGISFNSFLLVRDKGLNLFIYLVSIPMITDTFALLCGKYFGKHKMCPKISPHKTWEGAIGGGIIGTAIPAVIYYFLIGTFSYKIIIGTLFLSSMGQIGDLLFSKIKRENDIKDYSNIMPGHGGILDRLDSTIFIFVSFIYIITILF